jgi:hypothetical protein
VASVFAVVSKKVFETEARVAGKVLRLGQTWATSKYASTHAALKPLGEGGHVFLVTVRPPDEALWLVAVLLDVKGVKDGWTSKVNTTPITDITALKSRIKFANGSGITASKGKLGMSLQTPRTLSADDVTLLLAAAKPGAELPPAPPGPPTKVYHLNRHEKSKLPCLCQKCLDKAGDKVTVDGTAFVRREARAKDRVLYYWLPEEIASSDKQVRIAVEKRMKLRLADVSVPGPKKKSKRGADEDDE